MESALGFRRRFRMKNLVDGDADDRYYAVFYSKDGSIHLWPGSTQKECLEVLREVASSPKWGPRCMRTTVIKRDMSHCKDGFVFGSPKSLNVAGGSR